MRSKMCSCSGGDQPLSPLTLYHSSAEEFYDMLQIVHAQGLELSTCVLQSCLSAVHVDRFLPIATLMSHLLSEMQY